MRIRRAPPPDVLNGRACYARPFLEEHLHDPAYLGWLHDRAVTRTLGRVDYWNPVPFEDVQSYCRALFASATDYFFAVYDRSDDVFIGTLRAGHISWPAGTADVGVMIGNRSYWGRGIGLDAVRTLSMWLFDDVELRRLTGGCMAVNAAMIRIFQTLGFQIEGRFRQQDLLPEGGYCDHIHLGCFRDEFAKASSSAGHAVMESDNQP